MNDRQAMFQEFTEHVMADVMFKLRDIAWIKGDEHERLRQQFTNSHILLIVTSGRGRLRLENVEHQLRQDAIYICPPMSTFGIDPDSVDELQMYVMRFDAFSESKQRRRRLRVLREEHEFPLMGEVSVRSAGQLVLYCDSIAELWQQGGGIDRFRSQTMFQEMWYHIVKNVDFTAQDSATALERARTYMEEHYSQNITIEQLARIAEVSPKYFVDLYKKTYGVSAMDYVTELRISRAKQLMAQSHVKLREIAHQVGYNDEFYFSRKFKKEVGVSPTFYMKSRQRKIAACRAPIIGQMLALKMMPFAAPLHPKWTAYYYQNYRNDIPVHLSAFRQNENWKANIEMLQEAKPDVIISLDKANEQETEQLARIAPTLFVPYEAQGWREQLLMIGDFLGESVEARHWLAAYDEKMARGREGLRKTLEEETFLILRVFKNELTVHCNRSMNEVFYKGLQVKPAFVTTEDVYDQTVTLADVAALNPDRVLMLVCQEAETLETFKQLKLSAQWRDLKAVRNNRAYLIASDPWREYSALAHNRVLDQCLRLFSGDRP